MGGKVGSNTISSSNIEVFVVLRGFETELAELFVKLEKLLNSCGFKAV